MNDKETKCYKVLGRYPDEKEASFQSPVKGSGLPYYTKSVAKSMALEMAKKHPELEWSISR